MHDKRKKRITVTLIDFRNAFGEVNHHLIDTVLKFHHIPYDIREIIRVLYKSFHIALTTETFVATYLKRSTPSFLCQSADL